MTLIDSRPGIIATFDALKQSLSTTRVTGLRVGTITKDDLYGNDDA